MKKLLIIVVIVVLGALSVHVARLYQPGGIHGVGQNVSFIEGECIVINWDATEVEAEYALRKWQELRN